MDETPLERRKRWTAVLDRVHHEIVEIHHHKEIWKFFNDHLPMQPDSEIVHETLARWYVDSQAAAIRRICEPGGKLSLAGLLQSLKAHARELTRDGFLELWPQLSERGRDEHGLFRKMANEAFDKFAGPGGAHVDPDVIESDLRALDDAVSNVRRWADENVAHIGRKQSVTVTFGELDDAIEVIGEMLQRYTLLITAASLVAVRPEIQNRWKTPFTRPWF